jgi:serine/threonine-protein kinase
MPPTIPKGKVMRNRYRIHQLLHQSRHANIYLVEDQHLRGNVWAVREMQLFAVDSFEKSRIVAQFNAEGQVLSSLAHPGLAKVVDFFTEGNNLYIVREYVHGTDLGQLLEGRNTPLGERDALSAIAQVLEAIMYLWSRKLPAIFFRELCAQNIIFCKGGEVKLLDLGLARVFQPSGDPEALARVGSIDYASPEQFSEGGTFDQRSLVYSVGAILYHIMTRHNPALSPFSLEPVAALNPNVSPAVEEIVNRATENDPRNRYQTLAELKKVVAAAAKAPQAVANAPRGWQAREPKPSMWEVSASATDDETDTVESSAFSWTLGLFMLLIMSSALCAIYYYFFRT